MSEFGVLIPVVFDEDDEFFIPTFNRLAPHFKEIELGLDEPDVEDMNRVKFEGFANQENKLNIMSSTWVTTKTLHAIFATPKPSLVLLLIEHADIPLDRVIARRMTSSMSNLSVITFLVMEREDVDLNATLAAVCSNLRCVHMGFGPRFCSTKEAVDYYDRLLRYVRDYKKLEYIAI